MGGDVLLVAEGKTVRPASDVSTGATVYVDRPLQHLWVAQPGSDLAAPGVTLHNSRGDFIRTSGFQTNVNAFAAASERWFALARRTTSASTSAATLLRAKSFR